MPPQTKPVALPKTNGIDAKEWLEAHGLVAKRAAIRSSDYESMLHCPFQYYLSRRLGLVSSLRWSAALSRGSWFHKRLEHWNLSPLEAGPVMMRELDKRKAELADICKVRGIHSAKREEIMEREEHDMLTASAWYDVAVSYDVPGRGPLFHNAGKDGYFSKSWWKCIGTEIVAYIDCPDFGPMIAQFDMLWYHKTQNTVYIMDMKTCSESTISRLQICPIEFQTMHYMHMLKRLLEAGKLVKYDIPRDARLGGMIHVAVQKPTISFGSNDRDCEEYDHELKSGPRKGQIETRRTYSGEPRIDNYIERCKRWYFATGEYESQAPKRASDPPVNHSLTLGRTLDSNYTSEYTRRLKLIDEYRTCDPYPVNFPKSARHLNQFGSLSPFTPFYLTPVSDWPGVISTEGFIIEDRDDVKHDIVMG